jgi:hypothetical protein
MRRLRLLILLVLALQCAGLHAELLFRSVEQVDGQKRWSPARSYASPADIAYPGILAGGPTRPAEEVLAFFSGPLTRADLVSAGVMMKLLEAGKQKLAGNTVWFASDGGDIDVAMDLGRLLRRHRVLTQVGTNDQCASACVFAFMGGERRTVAGRLGIHRPYFPSTQDDPERQVRFRLMQKTLKDFIEELDFPNSLYEAVMLVPPESMKFLSAAELKTFYLEGISPSSEDILDAAAARQLGLSMPDYLRRKAQAPGGPAAAPWSVQQGEAASTGGAVGMKPAH